METSTKKSHFSLWEDLKKGNIVALGELYDFYIEDLFVYGMQISNDKGYVMDCIHDLFLDLYKYKNKITTPENIKYYLIKSLKRKINKKYSTKTKLVYNTSSFENISTATNHTRSIEEEIILSEQGSEKKQKLKRAFNFLTRRQKKVLFLRFNENKPYEEIADIMNVSVQTSRTIIYRGIKVLRQHMALLISLLMEILF